MSGLLPYSRESSHNVLQARFWTVRPKCEERRVISLPELILFCPRV
jgi:hypothetical protein